MKQKKLDLKEIKNALSRNEMKQIMAGSGNCVSGGQCGGYTGITCCVDQGLYCYGATASMPGQCLRSY